MSEIEWERGDLGSQAHVGGYELRVDMDALGWTANVYETANAVSVSVATREEAEAAAVEGLRRHLLDALCSLPPVEREWERVDADEERTGGSESWALCGEGRHAEASVGFVGGEDRRALASVLLSVVEAWRARRECQEPDGSGEVDGVEHADADEADVRADDVAGTEAP